MLKTVNRGGKIYYLYICSGMRGKPLSESSSVEPPKRLKLGAEVHRWTAAYAVPSRAGNRFGRVFEDCMGAT